MKFQLIGRYRQVIGLLKIVVDGQLRTQTDSSTKLRRTRMIKKIIETICWPWTKYIKWIKSGLPKSKDDK